MMPRKHEANSISHRMFTWISKAFVESPLGHCAYYECAIDRETAVGYAVIVRIIDQVYSGRSGGKD